MVSFELPHGVSCYVEDDCWVDGVLLPYALPAAPLQMVHLILLDPEELRYCPAEILPAFLPVFVGLPFPVVGAGEITHRIVVAVTQVSKLQVVAASKCGSRIAKVVN